MSNTIFDNDLNYNLCRDYSSYVKWSIDKISKSTTQWTDYSISEPDTLLLSSISTIHDYVQYTIDQMYLNTDLDVCSSKFLHQVSSAMGKFLWSTNSVCVPVIISNDSATDIIELSAFEMFSNDKELFTNPEAIRVLPKSKISTNFVRNTLNQKIYRLSDSTIGEYILEGLIERASIIVEGVTTDGGTEKLTQCNDILDLLFEETDLNRYMLISNDSQVFTIKLSPKSYQRYSAILVKYTLVDDYPVREGLILERLANSNPELTVVTAQSESAASTIQLTNRKLEYVNSLTQIDTLCNIPFNLKLGELAKKINHWRLTYETSQNSKILPKFEYTTIDNIPLLGDWQDSLLQGLQYVNEIYVIDSGTADRQLGTIVLKFEMIPVYDLTITYTDINKQSNTYVIQNTDLKASLKNLTFSATLPDIDLSLDTPQVLEIGFVGLGTFYHKTLGTMPKDFETVTSELQILYEIFSKNLLIEHELPVIRALTPQYLSLNSTITVSRIVDTSELITRIVDYLNVFLINNELVTNTYISNRRLEVLLLDHFDEIEDIQIHDIDRVIINPNKYLVMKSLEEYLQEITIKSRGDN